MRNLGLLVLSVAFWAVGPASGIDKVESHKLSILTSVFRMDAPIGGEKDYRVLSTVDGRIYKLEASNEAAMSALNVAISTRSNVELVLTPGNNDLISSVEILSASRADAFTLLNWEKNRANDVSREARNHENRLDSGFEPTVLDSKSEANKLFKSVYSYDTGYDVEDHCYDRAHYWARTFFTEDEVNSQKVFIFFTPKYQREHDFKWWFHVAPFVLVGASEREYVLDPTFESEPLTMKQWALDFATKAKKCYDGKNLGVYYSKGETEDCVLVRASMYHYTPSDLDSIPSVTSWRCADIRRVMSGIAPPEKKRSWDEVKGFLPANCR